MNWEEYYEKYGDLMFRIEDEPDLSNYIHPKDYSIEELLDFAEGLQNEEENYGAAYFYAECVYNYCEDMNYSRGYLRKPLVNQHLMHRAATCMGESEQTITGQLLNMLSQVDAVQDYSSKTKRILFDLIRPIHYKIYKNLSEKFKIVNTF